MPEMRAAVLADNFGPDRTVIGVSAKFDGIRQSIIK